MPTLESLPPEILFYILSFTNPFKCTSFRNGNPLSAIAPLSKHLNNIAEEYARSLLKQHAGLTPKIKTPWGYRKKWIDWLSKTCQECKKNSTRKAILDPDMTLCARCDKKVPKMTMTTAITKHGLSKLDLFTPNVLHPSLPRLKCGQYMCMGGQTVMISEPDVLSRKEYIHKLLGHRGSETAALKRRCAAHDRITEALDITFRNGRWTKAYKFQLDSELKVKKALRTAQDREKYARALLKKEWDAMGLDVFPVNTAIVVE